MENVLQLFYQYSTGPVALAAVAGAQTVANINVLNDADFACHYMSATVIQVGVVVLNWAGTVSINDSGVGRTLSNVAVPVEATTGDGNQPFPLPIPRLFSKSSVIVCTFTNPVATATTVHLVLSGYKLYPGEVLTSRT